MADAPKPEKDQKGSAPEVDFSVPKLPPWMPPPRSREQRWMEEAADSCIFKGAMSAAMGGALGAMFGIAFGGYDAPVDNVQGFKNKVRASVVFTGKRAVELGKSFAVLGAMFSVSECVIDRVRAKHDIYSGLAAGCISGAALARKTGPQGMAVSCAGMAAFSAVIDQVMHWSSR